MGCQLRMFVVVMSIAMVGHAGALPASAEDPTPEQALTQFAPIQPFVEFTTPPRADFARCTMRPEKENGVVAWVLRDPQGEILRRFADANGDNQVDTWCYYLDGVEVYRDIDSDFNKSADQFRWFNTGGTRWGADRNEDKQIDAWRVISPHEVAEELVVALRGMDGANRDADLRAKSQARFELLLLTPRELGELGQGPERTKSIGEAIKAASAGFAKMAAEQKAVTAKTRYIDFGSSRPATIPAGTNGSTKDVTVFENASALVQTGEKHEQLYLGTLVSVGNTWKLIGLPVVGSDNQGPTTILTANTTGVSMPMTTAAPTEEMQRLMAELQKLDAAAGSLPPDKQAANVDQRADLLRKLADATPDAELRGQWYRQLTDMLGAAVQSNEFNYAAGLEKLEMLQKQLSDARAGDDLVAHVEFQRMWGKYVASQKSPGADAAKLQDTWLAELESFTKRYPKSAGLCRGAFATGHVPGIRRQDGCCGELVSAVGHELSNSGASRKGSQRDRPFEPGGQAATAEGEGRRRQCGGHGVVPRESGARSVLGNLVRAVQGGHDST